MKKTENGGRNGHTWGMKAAFFHLFMLLLIVSPAPAREEAVLYWQYDLSAADSALFDSRLILETRPDPASEGWLGRLSPLCILHEREAFPLSGRSAWTRQFLPTLALRHQGSGSALTVGAIQTHGLLKDLTAPFGRALSPLSLSEPTRFTPDTAASPSRLPLWTLRLSTPPGHSVRGAIAGLCSAPVASSPQGGEKRSALSGLLVFGGGKRQFSIEALGVFMDEQAEPEERWFSDTPLLPSQSLRVWGLAVRLEGPQSGVALQSSLSEAAFIDNGLLLSARMRHNGMRWRWGLAADATSGTWLDATGDMQDLQYRVKAAFQTTSLPGQRLSASAGLHAERGSSFTGDLALGWDRLSLGRDGVCGLDLRSSLSWQAKALSGDFTLGMKGRLGPLGTRAQLELGAGLRWGSLRTRLDVEGSGKTGRLRFTGAGGIQASAGEGGLEGLKASARASLGGRDWQIKTALSYEVLAGKASMEVGARITGRGKGPGRPGAGT